MKHIEAIFEDITNQDGKLSFKYEKGNKSGTRFGKSGLIKKTNTIKIEPFTMKVDNDVSIKSIYNKIDLDVIKILKDRKTSIKNGLMTEKDYKHFVKRTALFINKVSNYSKNNAYIVTPETTTPLLQDIVDELNYKTGYDADVSFDGFKKNSVDKLEVDTEMIQQTIKDPMKREKVKDMMEDYIKKFQEQGYFKMKEIKLPQYRKYIKNLFTIDDEKLIEKLRGKNVIVLDDVLTSGTTLKSVYQLLQSLTDPKNIQMFTIFKR